jgi:putative ABC transport system ATP-binding protein
VSQNTGPANTGPANSGSTTPLPRLPAAPLVELRGAWVRYPGAASAALGPANLVVGHGELVAISGPAGAGKTTLLAVIGLLIRPTAGRYLLNGLDTAALGDGDLSALRGRQIGWVFQAPRLIAARTALDNVMVPLLYSGLARPRRQAAATAALGRVGMAGYAQVAAGRLSAGQQQAVAVARAIVTEPNLLLCDDPTASLDQAAARRVVGILTDLRAEGRTVLIASTARLRATEGSRHIRLTGAGSSGGGQRMTSPPGPGHHKAGQHRAGGRPETT